MADLTAAQIVALGTEITNDPRALGYAGKTVAQRTTLINVVGGSNEKIGAGVIPVWQLIEQIVQSEFIQLTVANQNLFNDFLAGGFVDASSATVQADFLAMFPSATAPTTRANLIALVMRSASRAEILFGAGTVVQVWEMARATGVPS